MKQVWMWFTHSVQTLIKGKGLSPSHLALILLIIGPAISYLALPIEGEYWANLMPDEFRGRAYKLAFAIDFVGGFLMYIFGRVQQSARTNSKQWRWAFAIIPFVVFGVLTSAFVNWRQLLSLMPNVDWWEPLIIASIQPGMQLGINVAQAIVEGKFDKQPMITTETEPVQKPSKSEPKASTKRPGKPEVDWWRSTYEQMDGERAQMTPERVQEIVQAEWETVPSRTTLYNWSDECVQSLDANGRGGHK